MVGKKTRRDSGQQVADGKRGLLIGSPVTCI